MKEIKKLLLAALLIMSISSCKEEKMTTDTGMQVARTMTTGEWVPGTVEHETDGDLTSEYEGFRLSFTADLEGADPIGRSFTTERGLHAFPASGTWDFVEGSNYTKVKRNDGVEVEVRITTEGGEPTLTLEMDIPEAAARLKGTSGAFRFTLQRD